MSSVTPSHPVALPPGSSHGHQRTFGETLQVCLFALLSPFAKKSRPRSPDEMFYVWPFKRGKRFKMELAVSVFPHNFNHRECDLPTRACSYAWQHDGLTLLWRLSSLNLIVGLCSHKSKLSMIHLHTPR